jgi:hypothetical protein
MEGTEANGARSDNAETVRGRMGRLARDFDGDEERMCVEEVGTGVGYLALSSRSPRVRFRGRGKAGDEKGSNAGRRDDTVFLAEGLGDCMSSWRSKGADMARSCSKWQHTDSC